ESAERGGVADVHLGSAPDQRFCGRRRVVPKWTVENVRRGQIKLYSLSFHQAIDQRQGDAHFRRLLARQQYTYRVFRHRQLAARAATEQESRDVEDIRWDRDSVRIASDMVQESCACKISLFVPLALVAVIPDKPGVFI